MNIYIGAYARHIEGPSSEKSTELLTMLIEHATQEKYTVSIP